MFPNSIQETVKSTLLDKATREDGDVWSNSKDDTYHRHHPRYQQQSRADSHPGTDGAVIVTVAEESSLNIDRSSRWDDGAVNEPIMSSSLSPYASATNNTIWQHHDPLDDLLLEGETTKYWPALPPGVHGLNVADPFKLAKADVDSLSKSIREDLIGTDHPVLNQAASYFFGTADGGKKVRPLMIMLVSRALADAVKYTDSQISADTKARSTTLKIVEPYQSSYNEETMFIRPLQWQRRDLPEAQRRLAEISEMIHTASLFHDDVIDGSDIRRGNPAVHMVFGNKTAILAGDYLLARASIALARLRHVEVVETMSTIIEHLVRGEIMQMRGNRRVSNSNGIIDDEMHRSSQQNQQQDGGSANDRMLYYLKKNYYKTGSLMANSCKSAALLADCPKELVLSSYQYGKHLGMAFQLVDDVLDFEGDVISMGKPALADLRAGLSTAPVLFAAEEYPELEVMMDRKFKNNGDVEKAREWVLNSSGMERTKNLARVHAERAMDSVVSWPGESIYRDALVHLAYKIVERTK
jgi:hexaprenyl-diphosphate synthase